MESYCDQIMTRSEAPSSSNYVCHLINEQLKGQGWVGTNPQPIPDWYSNNMKVTFKEFYQQWKKNDRNLTYRYFHPWKVSNSDDIIITDCKYDDTINIWPEFFGFFHCDFEYENRSPAKKINYLTQRVENSRLKILYSLYDRGLIDQCNISLIGLQNNDSPAKLEEYHEDCSAQDFFKDQMPYRNWSGSLEQSIVDCEMTLVHESFYSDPMKVLSEKTFRVLQLPRPFVIFGAPRIIEWLQEMGFEIGRRFVDHGYDTIEDHDQRREAVLSAALNFKWDDALLKEYEIIALKNKELLKKFRKEFPDKLKTVLKDL